MYLDMLVQRKKMYREREKQGQRQRGRLEEEIWCAS